MPLARFPTVDPAMHLRLKRVRMGLMSYLVFTPPLVYVVWHGWMDFGFAGLAAWYLLTAIVAWLVPYLAIRSGFSLRFRDPALTLLQISISAALSLMMISYAGDARAVLLMMLFTGFFFGIFGLSTRQMLALTAATLIGYAVLIVVPLWLGVPTDSPEFRMELLRFLTLGTTLVWLSLIGGYVGRLRQKLANAMERLRMLASHDELTGVYNRRHLMEILRREKERADRYDHPFSVCILDLDHFKDINDNHGHQAGDDVLRTFAQRMREQSRAMDWVAREAEEEGEFGRFGGEEFLLVLPHATMSGARICVERIRRALQNSPIRTCAGPLQVTFSTGIAEYRKDEPVQNMLNRADTALYRAKALGRDRVEDESGN